MAEAKIEETLNVDAEKFFKAVTAYAEYPKFVDGCTKALVESLGEGKTKVNYSVSLMKDITYTLEHIEEQARPDGTRRMSWKLLQSDFIKANSGFWEITPAGPGRSKIKYSIDIEFKIPVPGFMLSRLIKGSLPGMVKNFEKRALSG